MIAGAVWLIRQRSVTKARELDDARADARRWVERLGGQVLALTGTDPASKQALADAAERYNAAGSQMDQAQSVAQARQVTETAYEGLYYVRAARTTMGLDPGPELPPLPGQAQAGAVSEDRTVDVEGHAYSASPNPSGQQPPLLPRRHGRRTPRTAGLVLRAVVALGADRRGVGRRVGAPVHLDVLRDVRGGVRRRVRRWPRRRRWGGQGALDQGDPGGGDQGATKAATGAATRAGAIGAAAATGGGGDFGGGDWGGGGGGDF